VGPAVEQDYHRATRGAGFHVADVQESGIDLLQWTQRRVPARIIGSFRHMSISWRETASTLRPQSISFRLAQRPERRSDFGGEKLRLFPRREVAALVNLVVVDKFGICALCPTPRGLILLAGKDSYGHRNGDTFGVE